MSGDVQVLAVAISKSRLLFTSDSKAGKDRGGVPFRL